MPTFEQGDVVRVPFPYTDRPIRQHRPALVVSTKGTGEGSRLLWVLMITSAENRRWPSDVALDDKYQTAGLPAPSLIRTAKIATTKASNAEALGRLDQDLLKAALINIGEALGF